MSGLDIEQVNHWQIAFIRIKLPNYDQRKYTLVAPSVENSAKHVTSQLEIEQFFWNSSSKSWFEG